MNRSRVSILLALLLSLHVVALAGAQPPVPAAPVGSAFTYQGRLRTGSTPFNGRCDFQFSLWGAASGGTRIGGVLSTSSVTVSDGRFNVTLDFGAAAFDGQGRWLQVAVRCPSGSGGFTTLAPRQTLAPTPYAARATTAGSVAWNSITGKPAGFADNVDNTGDSVAVPLNLSGSITAPIIYAQSSGSNGTGIRGEANNGTSAYGVWGVSSNGFGVVGESTSGYGVAGASGSNIGVYGESDSGFGMRGISASNIGVYGSSTSNYGVRGFSTSNVGVYGSSTNNHGVRGIGVSGIGVYGSSTSGAGLRGHSASNNGVLGLSTSSIAIRGETTAAANQAGVLGIYGPAGNFFYYTAGVAGSTTVSNGTGVAGFSPAGVGVRGVSNTGYAGYFQGNVHVTGILSAVTKQFKIDHPLDPANQYLQHASVESSEMKNIYDGVATIGGDGTATVTLPDWFEALNQDFRYQLTCIGGFAQVYVAQEIQGGSFVIGGGTPGMKVSWQVTGVRHDPWAEQNPLQVEVAKSPAERGKYLNPQSYGQPATQSVDYAQANRSQSTVATPAQPDEQPPPAKSLRSELASKRP